MKSFFGYFCYNKVAKEEILSKFGYINLDAAEQITDICTLMTVPQKETLLKRLKPLGDIPIILGKGGFKVKGKVTSGDPTEK